MLGYDLIIACAKFQRNRFIIDGEIEEEHELGLHIYQNNCGPGYNQSANDCFYLHSFKARIIANDIPASDNETYVYL